MKRILIATLFGSVAMTGSALAQATAPDATATDPATQTQGTQPTQGTEAMPAEGAQSGMADGASQGMQSEGGFYTYQEGNQMLGSGLMGAEVWGADGESIGSVDDLLLDSEGQVMAVVVGVGGFLGIGEKDVAIANDQLEFVLAEEAAAAAPAANAPATAPATGTAATGGMATTGAGGASGTAMAPGTTAGTATGAGTTGAAGTGMTGTGGTGMAGTGTGMAGYGWGWTGAGIDHIEVSYTREQLEAAPAFEAAE